MVGWFEEFFALCRACLGRRRLLCSLSGKEDVLILSKR